MRPVKEPSWAKKSLRENSAAPRKGTASAAPKMTLRYPAIATEGTSVRLDVEQNQLVSVAAQVWFEIVCCKAHEICVFQRWRRRESVDKCRERRRVGVLS
jgi:hypothetical protein